MKITDITCHPRHLELKEAFVLGNAVNTTLPCVIIKVDTDTEIIGYGEVNPAWEVTGETIQSVREAVHILATGKDISEKIIGQELDSLESLEHMYDTIIEPKNSPALLAYNSSAKAGIEAALFDALGKKLLKPVYELLGGSYHPISLPLVLGIEPVDITLKKALDGIAAGYTKIKIKVGKKEVGNLDNFERDIQVVNQLCAYVERLNTKVMVCADANQGYGESKQAIAIVKRFNPYLSWIEQPVNAKDILGLAKVKHSQDIPIMADESLATYQDAHILAELDAADYFNIKLMKSGGIIGAKRIASVAALHDIPYQIGSMIESSLGTAMGAAAYLSLNCNGNELVGLQLLNSQLGDGIEIKNNSLLVSQQPGFGVHYDSQQFQNIRGGFT